MVNVPSPLSFGFISSLSHDLFLGSFPFPGLESQPPPLLLFSPLACLFAPFPPLPLTPTAKQSSAPSPTTVAPLSCPRPPNPHPTSNGDNPPSIFSLWRFFRRMRRCRTPSGFLFFRKVRSPHVRPRRARAFPGPPAIFFSFPSGRTFLFLCFDPPPRAVLFLCFVLLTPPRSPSPLALNAKAFSRCRSCEAVELWYQFPLFSPGVTAFLPFPPLIKFCA